MCSPQEVWLTEAELASSKYLNSDQHAALAVQAMRSRPHATNSALRAAGIAQYQHFVTRLSRKRKCSETVRVTQEAEMAAEHFQEVRSGLAGAAAARCSSLLQPRSKGNCG